MERPCPPKKRNAVRALTGVVSPKAGLRNFNCLVLRKQAVGRIDL
jgi:hypothetical protein